MIKKMKNILVLHGPNLNLLGEREVGVYGTMTLVKINNQLLTHAKTKGVKLWIFQSNSEGGLIDLIHKHRKWADGIVFNPAAYTHYSYALRDAIAAVGVPTIEVHLSNIKKRESFRKVSVIAPVCRAQVSGLGVLSYIKGIDTLLKGDR